MSIKEQYLEVAKTYLNAIGACDVDGVMNSLSDDVEYWIPGHHAFSGTHTKEVVKELMVPLRQIFPDGMKITTTSAICEGNRLAVEAEGSAVSATGKVYDNRYHFMFEFDSANRIRKIHEYMDTGHALEIFAG